jgi:hypothetical protein
MRTGIDDVYLYSNQSPAGPINSGWENIDGYNAFWVGAGLDGTNYIDVRYNVVLSSPSVSVCQLADLVPPGFGVFDLAAHDSVYNSSGAGGAPVKADAIAVFDVHLTAMVSNWLSLATSISVTIGALQQLDVPGTSVTKLAKPVLAKAQATMKALYMTGLINDNQAIPWIRPAGFQGIAPGVITAGCGASDERIARALEAIATKNVAFSINSGGSIWSAEGGVITGP